MSGAKSSKSLPVLDLRRFDEEKERGPFLADLRHAAREFGFIEHVARCLRHAADTRQQQHGDIQQ